MSFNDSARQVAVIGHLRRVLSQLDTTRSTLRGMIRYFTSAVLEHGQRVILSTQPNRAIESHGASEQDHVTVSDCSTLCSQYITCTLRMRFFALYSQPCCNTVSTSIGLSPFIEVRVHQASVARLKQISQQSVCALVKLFR